MRSGVGRTVGLALIGGLVAALVVVGCGDDEEAPTVRPEPEEPAPEDPAPEAPDEPVAETPDEATPDAPEEAPSEEPAAPTESVATVELDEPGLERMPLPEKMGNRIRSRLREEHDARVALRESIRLHHADGRDTVYAFYEHSEIEACTNRRMEAQSESRRDAFRACREQLFQGAVDFGIEAEPCTLARVVRAELAAPEAGRPADWGGAITLAADVELELGCQVDRLRAFRLADVDEDDQLELVIDLWTHTPDRTFRGMMPYTSRGRSWFVLRADALTTQADVMLASLGGDYEQMEMEERARRVSLRDDNGDGRKDLIVETQVMFVSFDDACGQDADTGWPTDMSDDGEDGCRSGELTREVRLHDAATDSWVAPD